ncbi:helix-turn-helix domain-containing protein [Terriglobus saanensis]|uniref:Helix-turn-helix domain protein n=1 Tax=Terriglobus saanensis (strain ATCC BAA-1853 / DSM 23119 / SP1PR4) TaxID=401053 RepID=E8V6U0_TERSS|nr:XRE family transcriptional regulator [Terriglobus saanensis]ADV83892.1 helix-turn-helix domain protein [Terriglobus saanensis SP1PR4]
MEHPETPDLPPNTVNAANVDEVIEAKSIGSRIRSLRLRRSMGLVDLGSAAGLSASFLSQLETGRVVPTLRNLARIASVFDKDLSYFFRDEKKSFFRISRAENRIRLPAGEKSNPVLLAESMSVLIPDRSTIPCIADFLPGRTGDAFHPRSSAGLEFIYIIEGSLTVRTDQETEVLEETDSAWLDGAARREYECTSKGPAKALIITFPKDAAVAN